MDSQKFARLVREFPFIAKIFAETNLSADLIGNIRVKRGDRNLLEAKPCAWYHDVGSYGEHSGHRLFWCVASGETIQFNGAWSLVVPYQTYDHREVALIGAQLLNLNRDVHFIVEVHEEHWDWEKHISDVVIYKMKGLDWRRFCRPAHSA